MNDKVIVATIVGFEGSDSDKKHVEYKYSIGKIYKFIQLTNMPTDLAFVVYEYLNPMHIIDITHLKKLIYEIDFNRQTGIFDKKFPYIYEEKIFEDSKFTERFKYMIKNIVKKSEKNLKLSYINFKFVDGGKLYSVNLKFKKNTDLYSHFSLKFPISDAYIGKQRKCNSKHTHNLRLCKFSH